MGAATYYKKGEWKACCDICGKVFKSGQLLLQWNGLRTCIETCFELRNAQELLKMPRPEQALPWARNCSTDCNASTFRSRVLDAPFSDEISLG